MAILVPRQAPGALTQYAAETIREPGTRTVGTPNVTPKMIREAVKVPSISTGVTPLRETVRTGTTPSSTINPLAGAAMGALAANIISQRAQRPTLTPPPGGSRPTPTPTPTPGPRPTPSPTPTPTPTPGPRPTPSPTPTPTPPPGPRPSPTPAPRPTPAPPPGGPAPSVPSGTRAIPNPALPGEPGHGWQYFTDGTAIAPNGEYYKDGEPVWSPHPTGEFYWTTTQVDTSYLQPGDPGYGYQYFSDGTVITPEGDYYKNGELVWSPGGTDTSLDQTYLDLEDSGGNIIEFTDPGYYYDYVNPVDVFPVQNWDQIVNEYTPVSDVFDTISYDTGGFTYEAPSYEAPSYDYAGYDYGGYDYGGYDFGGYDFYGKEGGMATPLMKKGGVIKMSNGGDAQFEEDWADVTGGRYTFDEIAAGDPSMFVTTTGENTTDTPQVTEISNPALPGQVAYGWRYFTDGTAIDPQGNYYFEGEKVYDPNVGYGGFGARSRNIARDPDGAASGALTAVQDFITKNPGTSGALAGALLSQVLSQSTGGGRENLGVDMTKFGAISPRSTTFGVGAPRFMTYEQYGTPQAMPEMYGTELYRNLNAPGFNPVNPVVVGTQAAAPLPQPAGAPQQNMRRGGLAHMADGGSTYYTYGRPINPADNLMAAGGQPMMGGGAPMVEGRMDYRHGSAVNGAGDGQSDDIPAMLADGEYVIDAETVAMLGNGSNKAGAEKLDEFRMNIRKHKRDTPLDKIPPPSKSPLAYLKGAKNG